MTEEELQALQETNKQLTERITQLESINIDLVTQKKELKQKIEDGVTDEDLKAELDNYKEQLSLVEADKVELTDGYTKELNSLKMSQQLKEMGVKVHNTDAMNAVTELALQEATYKDGGFVFLNEDGTTRFNDANKDFGIQDKINELKEGDKSYLFVADSGGGVTPTDVAPSKPTSSTQAIADKYSY